MDRRLHRPDDELSHQARPRPGLGEPRNGLAVGGVLDRLALQTPGVLPVEVEPDQPGQVPVPYPGEEVPDLRDFVCSVPDTRLCQVDRPASQPPDVPQLVPENLVEILACADVAVDADPVDVFVARVPHAGWVGDHAGLVLRVLVRRVPRPDDIPDPLGSEDVVEMPPRRLKCLRPRPGQAPRLPPAVHPVAEGQNNVAGESLDGPRVASDVAVVRTGGELRHADPARVELDQRCLDPGTGRQASCAPADGAAGAWLGRAAAPED